MAVLSMPIVLPWRACTPSLVLLGESARATRKSANHTRALRRQPHRRGDRQIDFLSVALSSYLFSFSLTLNCRSLCLLVLRRYLLFITVCGADLPSWTCGLRFFC